MTTEIGIHPEDGVKFSVNHYHERGGCHEFYTVEIIAGDTVVKLFMRDCGNFDEVFERLDGMKLR
jgi:hypothetical protein